MSRGIGFIRKDKFIYVVMIIVSILAASMLIKKESSIIDHRAVETLVVRNYAPSWSRLPGRVIELVTDQEIIKMFIDAVNTSQPTAVPYSPDYPFNYEILLNNDQGKSYKIIFSGGYSFNPETVFHGVEIFISLEGEKYLHKVVVNKAEVLSYLTTFSDEVIILQTYRHIAMSTPPKTIHVVTDKDFVNLLIDACLNSVPTETEYNWSVDATRFFDYAMFSSHDYDQIYYILYNDDKPDFLLGKQDNQGVFYRIGPNDDFFLNYLINIWWVVSQ